jgi:hypothetical protein
MNTTEANIQRVLDDLKMPAETFCKLSGVSTSRWSRALSGTLPLNGAECQKLTTIARELKEFAEVFAPAPLNFKNFEGISVLLKLRWAGIRWDVKAVTEAEPVASPVESAEKVEPVVTGEAK